MQEAFEYRTIADNLSVETREKSSRFIAFAYHVEDEKKVHEFLTHLSETHPKATHICYAYRFNPNRYRANDNGEPSGTAGKPILGQIDSKGLTHTLVAVVRYYGGTKLGVQGLIAAYKEAASEVLAIAGVRVKTLEVKYEVSCDHMHYNELLNLLKRKNANIIDTQFTEKSQLMISIEKKIETDFINSLREFYQFHVELKKTEL